MRRGKKKKEKRKKEENMALTAASYLIHHHTSCSLGTAFVPFTRTQESDDNLSAQFVKGQIFVLGTCQVTTISLSVHFVDFSVQFVDFFVLFVCVL